MYIIVKNAGSHWAAYYEDDPKKGSVHQSHSAHFTYTGRKLGIKPNYTDKRLAELDCERLIQENPIGDYAVCSLA